MSRRSVRIITCELFTSKSQAWIKFFSKPALSEKVSADAEEHCDLQFIGSDKAKCLSFLCHLCLKRDHAISNITENSQSGQSTLTTRANKFCPGCQLQLIVSPNGLEWPPAANGDSIISEFHGLCAPLLHRVTVKIYFRKEKEKGLTGHEDSVLSIKLVGRGRSTLWRFINIHSVLSQ